VSWLTILPFELIAASITIKYWRDDISMGVWATVFLVVLCVIQIFGVRGYGEGKHQPVGGFCESLTLP
jgi:yeast amino acid transporter